jgi:hypothetical protein
MNPVILLNAPPNAGKDTIAEELSIRLGLPHREFKGKLFEIAQVIAGLDQAAWDAIYTREQKELPQDCLWGLTPRQFMIDVSERMIKPTCGQQYFGKALSWACLKTGAVVSDSGFNEEAEALCSSIGAERVYCVRFTREGCSFEGDSRNFLDTDAIKHYIDLENNGSVEDIVQDIINWVRG